MSTSTENTTITMDTAPIMDETKEEIVGLDDENTNEENQYYVISSDDVQFPLSKEECKLSSLLTTALENDENDTFIPLPSVHSSILEHIIHYLKYHTKNDILSDNIPVKIESNNFSNEIKDKWDVDFIENTIMRDPETAKQKLYDTIQASNYMHIQPLLELTTAKVACMIKGENIDAIKRIISVDYPYENNHQ